MIAFSRITIPLAVLASAALYGLIFPPQKLWWLAWFVLVPLFVALQRVRLSTAAGLSFLWGIAAAYATGTWFARAASTFFDQSDLVGVGAFLFVAATMVGPYYLVAGVCYHLLARRFRGALPLLAASAWVMGELARGRLLTGTPFFIGNPWALLGYSQVGVDTVMQIASVTGIYGVSFVVVATNAAFAELWLALSARDRPVRGAVLALATGGAMVALVFGHGMLTLPSRSPADPESEGTRISIVQGNLELGRRWRSDFYGKNLDVYMRLTWEAIQAERPEIVFWPEASMTFFVDQEPLYRRSLASVLGPGNVELVAGAPRIVEDEAGQHFYNSIFLFTPRGEITGRYDKQFLVPFTEYFPFRIDLLRRSFGSAREFTHGGPTPPLETRAGAAGIVTCNEGMLPEVVSQRVDEGAAYIVNPSNDTWIADRGFAELQFDVISVRAIEQRRTLVRASTSGPSAIVDPWGRVVARSDALTRDVIHGYVLPRKERSLYNRFGDLFGLTCVAVTLFALLGSRWPRRDRA